ncbi:transcriptional regulator [Actinoplanes sp. SE50]|uniref:TetR/AcrR family transcriptional regulator n=1 Tax=unclassified Actinoplanes TaxID=2626549 RepID=UPI00023ED25E|nr:MULTISPECIES: TetR family transcriptional regulator [unclassified Actinoplanes]AEV84968.1 HTH-type transcriptional regulator betI [Actinoplanes sp. SE50/110]ATO83359.1 transcriptional regulator [Actinoplanes sp. SE50]SLM00766.1 TetR family transcriptional regulator [Actinoplanes sp. SE50/110]
MGNREALIEGAKRCLTERGWARTTVRDIAFTAGVNHAAIGYHFGSRESLLVHALVEAVEELSETVATQAQDSSAEARWQALIDTFGTHRALWIAQLEAAVQAEHSPELRERLAAAQRQGREGLGGSVPLALLSGLMLQWLVDPDEAPDGAQVVSELRAQAAEV